VAHVVLIADDSPTIQKRAQGILKGEGYEVETVSNGVAAIKKLAKLQPVVVLADVSMPGKDGYEVCEFIRSSEALHHVPVLLIASELEPYDEGRGARVGANGRVKKPFEPHDLIAAVGKFAAQSEAAALAPKPVAPVAPPPPPAFEVAPVDEEAEVQAKQAPTFAGVSEGIAFAEPVAEAIPASPVEVAPEVPSEPVPEAPAEVVPAEAPRVHAEAATEPSAAETEPVLVEEPLAVAPEVPSVPATEQTVVFHTPAEIAEPVVTEEAASPLGGEALPSVAEAVEAAPVPATGLESYAVSEAAGQVQVAPEPAEPQPEVAVAAPEVAEAPPAVAEAPPAMEHEAAPPAPEPAPIDHQLIYSIVHKVVVRMSPPALPAAMIDQVARQLTDEITAELHAESTKA